MDGEEASSSGELSGRLLSLVARSAVLHTGTESTLRDTLSEAVSGLPVFSLEEAVRLLDVVAAAVDCVPVTASQFLAPIHPALRVLSVRECARAWVLADFLCLDTGAARLEEEIVQLHGGPLV